LPRWRGTHRGRSVTAALAATRLVVVSHTPGMIEVEHLTKDYGTVVAVRDVSFSVGKGEVVGFLGPNGAGKSTTLRIIAGFLGMTAGRVRINGFDIVEQSLEARRCIGYMPEAAPLYTEMRVGEYLRFRAALKRVPRRERAAAVDRAMRLARVSDMVDTLILHLSKGYRQRVGLADALVSNPPLLILDEPTAGLDPNQIREVRKVIRELGESHTILLSTHILSEVETTCDRALVIDRGQMVAEGTIDELRASRRADSALLVLRDPQSRATPLLESIDGVRKVRAAEASPAPAGPPFRTKGDELVRIELIFDDAVEQPGDVLERAVAALAGAGIGVREAAPAKTSLEDVFTELTRGEKASKNQSAGREETAG
jgi:ABC-2 type transport system ATP-binding protein